MVKKIKKRSPDQSLPKAKELFRSGNLLEAAEILSDLLRDFPDDEDVRFTYASVLFNLKRYAEAAPQFEAILRARPVYEWASVGLFHSLWKTGRKTEALKEIRRFYDEGGESMEYRRLIKDIKEFL